MTKTRLATCSCGTLRIVTRGDPVRISICHCKACQRRTGNVFGAQARFTGDQVEISGDSSEYIRTADSGNNIILNFCADCGATVYYRLEADPDIVAVPVGAFADPDFPEPTISVYTTRRHHWVSLPENIKTHD